VFLFLTNIFSQVQFTPHTITTSSEGYAKSVYAIDMDGDGDMDVLSAWMGNDKVAWYENGGNEYFPAHTITDSAWGAMSVYAVDMDDDGDMDVLAGLANTNRIYWYENDGNENFTPDTITTRAPVGRSVYAVDVDDDGDMDVLSANSTWLGGKIAWYENDGNENFIQHVIAGLRLASSIYAIDLDDDGDMDVLSVGAINGIIAWYENDGNENFTPDTITASAGGASSVFAIDLDDDGDTDVLSASFGENPLWQSEITWYENDGSEIFTTHTITDGAEGAESVYAVDMDDDGDMDVLSASWDDNKIAWYENDGSEIFTTHIITTSAEVAACVYASDVDDDGDMDVLSASKDNIAWYENLGPTSVEKSSLTNLSNKFNLLQNYPNPFNPSTIIEFSLPKSELVELKVHNILGKEVSTLVSNKLNQGNHSYTFDGKNLASGIYYYQLLAGDYTEVKKMILLR
jgi:predicted RNA methylase